MDLNCFDYLSGVEKAFFSSLRFTNEMEQAETFMAQASIGAQWGALTSRWLY